MHLNNNICKGIIKSYYTLKIIFKVRLLILIFFSFSVLKIEYKDNAMAYSTPFSQSSFSPSSMYLKSGGMGAMGAYHMGLGNLGMALDPMHAYGNPSKYFFLKISIEVEYLVS